MAAIKNKPSRSAAKSKSANTVHVKKSPAPKTVKNVSVNQATNPHGDTPHGRKRYAAEMRQAAQQQLTGG